MNKWMNRGEPQEPFCPTCGQLRVPEMICRSCKQQMDVSKEASYEIDGEWHSAFQEGAVVARCSNRDCERHMLIEVRSVLRPWMAIYEADVADPLGIRKAKPIHRLTSGEET